jgi:hypothetical protein
MNDKNAQLPAPGSSEYALCSVLVAKAIIAREHSYSEDEIAVATRLLGYQWNQNVTDFLYVIAGILQTGEDVPEAYAALVFKYEQPSKEVSRDL